MVQPLWKTAQRFLKRLKIGLPCDPATPLLGIYPNKKKSGYQKISGRAQGLTPASPAVWEAKEGGSPDTGVQGQPGQHGKTPISTKTYINELGVGVSTYNPIYLGAEAGRMA